MYTSRSKLNLYAIMCNGVHVGNVTAKNNRSAILAYGRSNGVAVYRGASYGNCGVQSNYCSKSIYNGFRACGRKSKCRSNYAVATGIGIMTSVMTPMGRDY